MRKDALVRDNVDIRLLRGGKTDEFNQKAKAEAESIDLKNTNLRLADLRGVDFSEANLEDAAVR